MAGAHQGGKESQGRTSADGRLGKGRGEVVGELMHTRRGGRGGGARVRKGGGRDREAGLVHTRGGERGGEGRARKEGGGGEEGVGERAPTR